MKHLSLLRGINVGGHKKVPMAELKTLLTKEGYSDITTILNTGNIIYTASISKIKKLQSIIESHFGFPISTITLPFQTITDIIKSDPFKKIKQTPKTKLYLTFTKDKPNKLKTPYTSEDKSFTIIKIKDNIIYSVLDLEKSGSIHAMKILEQHFGKNITTRNYNTILKIAKK